nr:hypothetical protein [Tanacetum cinerariifolium]
MEKPSSSFSEIHGLSPLKMNVRDWPLKKKKQLKESSNLRLAGYFGVTFVSYTNPIHVVTFICSWKLLILLPFGVDLDTPHSLNQTDKVVINQLEDKMFSGMTLLEGQQSPSSSIFRLISILDFLGGRSCTSERAKVYYECMEPFKSLMCLWVRSKSIAATWLEKVVTPLIVPAIKGFAAAPAVLKLKRLKVDKY